MNARVPFSQRPDLLGLEVVPLTEDVSPTALKVHGALEVLAACGQLATYANVADLANLDLDLVDGAVRELISGGWLRTREGSR